MNKRFFIETFMFLAIACRPVAPGKHNYILFYKPYVGGEENNFYDHDSLKFNMERQYANLKKADVLGDMQRAINHKDYRFISIDGVGYLYPGLERDEKDKNGAPSFDFVAKWNERYLEKFGSKVIDGTNDSHSFKEPDLQLVAYDYAKRYNLMLLSKIKLMK
jgi:hypothetical protein